MATEDPQIWDDVDPPVEHIADRGLRKFPAHLDHEVVEHRPLHWWLRYRDKPSPAAPDWTYRRRHVAPSTARPARAEGAHATQAASGQEGAPLVTDQGEGPIEEIDVDDV